MSSLSEESFKDKSIKPNEGESTLFKLLLDEEDNVYVTKQELLTFSKRLKEKIEKGEINSEDKESLLIRMTTMSCELEFLKQLLHNRIRDLREEIKSVEVKLDNLEEVTYRSLNVNNNSGSGNTNIKSKDSVASRAMSTIVESPLAITIIAILATTLLTFFLQIISVYIKYITGVDIPVPKVDIPVPEIELPDK